MNIFKRIVENLRWSIIDGGSDNLHNTGVCEQRDDQYFTVESYSQDPLRRFDPNKGGFQAAVGGD